MPKPRANSKRTQIVTAALRLFAEKGIKATTVRDIAATAGVTEGALYRHFAGKDCLAQSLFCECARLLYERLSQGVEGVRGARERLAALVTGFFDFAENDPEAYEFVMARHHDTIGGLPPGQPMPKDIFVEVIEEGMASGELRRMDAHLGAAMVIGVCLRTIFFLDRGMIELGRDEVIAEVCRAVRAIFEMRS